MTAPAGARQRVAITGMGAVTPCGLGAAALWSAVATGRSAIRLLEGTTFSDSPVRIGGQVHNFDAARWLPRPLARRLSPVQHWAAAAADEALTQAGVIPPAFSRWAAAAEPPEPADLPWPRERLTILVGSGSGPVDAMQAATRALDARGPHAVPFTLAVYGAADAAASLLAARYGAWGSAHALSATCASSALALGAALRTLRHGYADAVLVVGMEDCLNAVNLAANARMQALATGYEDRPQDACRPFDRGRSGFVMSAGACALLLETEAAARARSAQPLAELAGCGAASDAWHATAPRPDGAGAARAMQACLQDAGVAANAVDHVNTHGTGTVLGDAAEIAALQRVFGARGSHIPLAATKAVTGHLLGAAGAAEAILAVHSLRSGLVPPTPNLQAPAFPDWDIVAGAARQVAMRTVLSNSFGFGGHDAALLFRIWSEEAS